MYFTQLDQETKSLLIHAIVFFPVRKRLKIQVTVIAQMQEIKIIPLLYFRFTQQMRQKHHKTLRHHQGGC